MLGDINPQSVRIAQQAVVYPGRNHVNALTIKRYDGRSFRPIDLTDITRVVLAFPQTSPTIVFDSTVDSVFTWAGNVLTVDLSEYAMPASIQPSYLIVFDAEHPQGQVLVDNLDATLDFEFRLVPITGTTPPPTVEFITEAPQDGETYGRKDGAWVTLVSGVVSVNGQTGTVVLDAADVGAATAAQGALADSAVQPGDLAAVATSGAYADLSGTPTLGTAAAADTGDFDPAGAAVGAVAAHVAEADPHTQYLTGTEADAAYAPIGHIGAGGAAHANAVASGAAGFMTGADKAKLDGVAAGATANANTDSLTEGSTNLYFTAVRVLATLMNGFTLVAGGTVLAADSLLVAIGKLQSQINGLTTALGGKQATLVSGTNIKSVNGASLLGSGDLVVSGGASLPVVQALSSTRTLVLADVNTFNVNSTTNNYTVTIQPQSAVTWTDDAEIHFLPSSTGDIVITGGAGVSVNGVVAGSATLSTSYGAASIKRIAPDSWWVGGAVDGNTPASFVSIEDTGDYYTGTDVESALQEVGAMIGDIATTIDLINDEVI